MLTKTKVKVNRYLYSPKNKINMSIEATSKNAKLWFKISVHFNYISSY